MPRPTEDRETCSSDAARRKLADNIVSSITFFSAIKHTCLLSVEYKNLSQCQHVNIMHLKLISVPVKKSIYAKVTSYNCCGHHL